MTPSASATSASYDCAYQVLSCETLVVPMAFHTAAEADENVLLQHEHRAADEATARNASMKALQKAAGAKAAAKTRAKDAALKKHTQQQHTGRSEVRVSPNRLF